MKTDLLKVGEYYYIKGFTYTDHVQYMWKWQDRTLGTKLKFWDPFLKEWRFETLLFDATSFKGMILPDIILSTEKCWHGGH
jgi:hypothetical protein